MWCRGRPWPATTPPATAPRAVGTGRCANRAGGEWSGPAPRSRGLRLVADADRDITITSDSNHARYPRAVIELPGPDTRTAHLSERAAGAGWISWKSSALQLAARAASAATSAGAARAPSARRTSPPRPPPRPYSASRSPVLPAPIGIGDQVCAIAFPTGTECFTRGVVLPSPSWPWKFPPQHQARLSGVRTAVWKRPSAHVSDFA